MKRIYMVAVLLLFIFNAGKAQKKPKINIGNPPVKKGITNLKVGEALPDFKIRVFNDQQKFANISDYNDRLLILDFGNTGCAGCVAALPHMESLQKQFGSKVKLFWVTPEYEEDVQDFWVHNNYTKNNTLPTIVEDSIARAYFKHRMWPHEAWIYKGKVIAITGPDYVNAANIEKVLSGAEIKWPVKDDFYVFDAAKESLFALDANQVGVKQAVIKYAAIRDYKQGAGGAFGIARNPVMKTVRAYASNVPVYDLLYANYIFSGLATSALNTPNSIVWEVSDKSKYKHDTKVGNGAGWLLKHGICFESLNPDTGQTDQEVYKTVIADLNRLLGLNVRWEKRKEKALVLIKTNQQDKIKSKKTIKSDQYNHTDLYYSEKGKFRQFRDASLGLLVYKLNQEERNPYVFEETGYKGKVDLDLNISSWTDIAGIRKALLPYGLDLKTEERLVDKFVFSEVNGGLLINQPPNVVK